MPVFLASEPSVRILNALFDNRITASLSLILSARYHTYSSHARWSSRPEISFTLLSLRHLTKILNLLKGSIPSARLYAASKSFLWASFVGSFKDVWVLIFPCFGALPLTFLLAEMLSLDHAILSPALARCLAFLYKSYFLCVIQSIFFALPLRVLSALIFSMCLQHSLHHTATTIFPSTSKPIISSFPQLLNVCSCKLPFFDLFSFF